MAVAIPMSAPASRRALWAAGFWGTLASGGALAGAAGLAYLVPRRGPGVGDAGAMAEYAHGDVRVFPGVTATTTRLVWWGYFVVRRADGFVAFPALCAHQSVERCVLAWQPDRPERGFACFCHGGGWHPATGEPIEVPPPGGAGFVPHHFAAWPLLSLPVRLVRGRVRVDFSGVTERERHQPPLVTPAR